MGLDEERGGGDDIFLYTLTLKEIKHSFLNTSPNEVCVSCERAVVCYYHDLFDNHLPSLNIVINKEGDFVMVGTPAISTACPVTVEGEEVPGCAYTYGCNFNTVDGVVVGDLEVCKPPSYCDDNTQLDLENELDLCDITNDSYCDAVNTFVNQEDDTDFRFEDKMEEEKNQYQIIKCILTQYYLHLS